MRAVMASSGRYHYNEFGDIYAVMAKAEDLAPEQIVAGSGSSEVLHTAVDLFTSATRPLISVNPAYEAPRDVARNRGGARRAHLPLQSQQPDLRSYQRAGCRLAGE